MSAVDDYPLVRALDALNPGHPSALDEIDVLRGVIAQLSERAHIAEADADRLAEALEVTALQADPFQQGNVDRLIAAHREAIATRPA